MKITDARKADLMTVRKIERDGNDLIIRGKVFGAMPVAARLTPQEARAGLKLLTPRVMLFLITLPFRKSTT
jgi:type II secretory ATPase GspE/PulE/Tfp pilus assembly ATPase PilB-like protein